MKKVVNFLLLLFFGFSAFAQDKNIQYIYGNINNRLTKHAITEANVFLERPDGVVVDSIINTQVPLAYGGVNYEYCFGIPRLGGYYIIRVEADGYETGYLAIDSIAARGRTNGLRYTGDILLNKKMKEQQLGEAVVKATRIKIYSKGDTLVYNADAFQLAEGSMLDALIKQLPGAELKDNGCILVNGKQIESLQLNGEDFFRGNNELMLDNLPSYMVQNIKVYEKTGELSRFGVRDLGDKTYVMDVRLKRQYSIGWVANIDGGYGTEDRYMARLFAMRFTPQSRISVFANFNNLNDNRKPGEDNEWRPENMPNGIITTKYGGVDYLVKDRNERFKLQGSAEIRHWDATYHSINTGETFLSEGSTWSKGENWQRSKNLRIGTSHDFLFYSPVQPGYGLGKMAIQIKPSFNYYRWDNSGYGVSAEFKENPENYVSAGLLDSIYRPNIGELLRHLALNRYLSENKENGRQYNGGAELTWRWRPNTTDMFAIASSINYSDNRNERFVQERYDYPSSPDMPIDFRNKWIKDHPNRNLRYHVGTTYLLPFMSNDITLQPTYIFGQSFSQHDYALHRLDRLDGWGENTTHVIGSLPSEADFLFHTIDPQNSYMQEQTETWHEVDIRTRWKKEESDRKLEVVFNLPLRYTHYHLKYARSNYHGTSRRNTFFVQPQLNITHSWHNFQRSISFNYHLTGAAPEMTDLLEIERNDNPLYVYNGNTNLKNSHTHTLGLNYTNNSTRKQRTFGLSAGYTIKQDAIAWGYSYNPQTGVRYYQPYNIDGNYLMQGNINYSMPLDKKRRFTFSTNTYGAFRHGVDMLSITGETPQKSSVLNTSLNETLKLSYRIGNTQIGVKGALSWGNARSERTDFETFSVYDFNYGLTALSRLFWDIEVSTDLSIYSRRGYGDASYNSNDLVWNVRLSKHIPKINLTVYIDGFDLLHQLSNITHSINSQGRTETYRNVIPRYFMFHLVYKLYKQPKKRPGD